MSNIEVVYENIPRKKKVIFDKRKGALTYRENGVYYSGVFVDNLFRNSFFTAAASLSLLNAQENILVLGTGAGSLAHTLRKMHPHAAMDVVDIDEETKILFDIFAEYCGIKKEAESIHLIFADANEYVSQMQKKYDFVTIDIFNGRNLLDFVTSFSFWRNLYRNLNDNGIIAFNTQMRNWFFDNEAENPLYELTDIIYKAGFAAVYFVSTLVGGWLYVLKKPRNLEEQLIGKSYEMQDMYLEAAMIVNTMYIKYIPPTNRNSDHTMVSDITVKYNNFIMCNVIREKRRRYDETAFSVKNLFTKEFVHNCLHNKMDGNDLVVCSRYSYFEAIAALIQENKNWILENKLDSFMLPDLCVEACFNSSYEELHLLANIALYSQDEPFDINCLRKFRNLISE